MRARTLGLLLVPAAIAAAAPPSPADAAKRPALRSFEDCRQLARYGQRHLGRFQPGAMPAPAPVPAGGGTDMGSGGGAGRVAAPAPAAPERGEDFSGTNVQEAGVYEPDVLKTDGSTVFALADGTLRAVDVSGGAPELVGSLALAPSGHGHRMLLRKSRLLVMWQAGARTVLADVDVGDPARPAVLRTLTADGALVAARRTGTTVRVVLGGLPRPVDLPQPVPGFAARAAARAPERGKAWLPKATLRNRRGKAKRRGALVGCRSVRRPRAFSGLETTTVLTLDLAKGLDDPVDADAVLSGADTVYASKDGLFVATRRYARGLESRTTGPVPDDLATEIHAFDTRRPTETTYSGSGRVPGFLLNQFALSQQGDVLRVASTQQPPWFAEGRPESESFVTTLRVDGGGLERIGQVGGLGRGERIFGVRFLGDVGYVVTFRQVDPLYTVDLSDPAAPRVRGELKILGYSAYLHPVGDGLLLGVGQDATAEGQRTGTLVSLFDVSDLDAPKLLQRAALAGSGSSAVEYDHQAFLWWPRTNLAVLPVQLHGGGDPRPAPAPEPAAPDEPAASPGIVADVFRGAVGFTVAPAGIAEAGRVTHGSAPITRSMVIGDRLYTLSALGLKASRLDTLEDVAFATFRG